MGVSLLLALSLMGPIDQHEEAHQTALLVDQCAPETLRLYQEAALRWRRIAKEERAEKIAAQSVRDWALDQPPIVQTVVEEVMPWWGWLLSGAGALSLVGGVATIVVIVQLR